MPERPYRPTIDDIQAWQSLPVSRWFLLDLERLIAEKQEYMGQGNCFVSGDMAASYSNQAQAVAYIEGIRAAQDIAK